MRRHPTNPIGFTLVELLVVVAVVGVLIGLLVPALAEGRRTAKLTICGSNLRQLGIAVRSYANDYTNSIPFGPKAPPATAINFYPVEGNVTSLISLYTGQPVGLGLLLDRYVAKTPRVLFCVDPDQALDTDHALANVGVGQSQGSFYYRHGSVSALSPITNPNHRIRTRLDDLGENRLGHPVKILATDTQFHAPDGLVLFGIVPRSHHRKLWSNALAADGSVAAHKNTNDRFRVDITTTPYEALDRILTVFETLDTLVP